jgi:hypothetical protein
VVSFIGGGNLIAVKNINVNDSQNLAFATSHFVIELPAFDYLNNQKQ